MISNIAYLFIILWHDTWIKMCNVFMYVLRYLSCEAFIEVIHDNSSWLFCTCVTCAHVQKMFVHCTCFGATLVMSVENFMHNLYCYQYVMNLQKDTVFKLLLCTFVCDELPVLVMWSKWYIYKWWYLCAYSVLTCSLLLLSFFLK